MIVEVKHPLIDHHLTRLRDVQTPPNEFRAIVYRLTMLLAYEATKDLDVAAAEVETPLGPAKGARLQERIGVIPILRAGLGMVDPVLDLLPHAEVWHLGFYRDEKTLNPVEYYKKLPASRPVGTAFVLDPMLATGGSASAAVTALRDWGVARVKFLAMLAAPEGIEALDQRCPGTEVFVCAIDSHLNEHGFIVPGLGDAGDRMFNAKAS